MNKKKILLITEGQIIGDPRIERMYRYLLNKKIILHTASSVLELKKNHFLLSPDNNYSLRKMIKKNFFSFIIIILKTIFRDLKTYCQVHYESVKNLNLNQYDYIFVFDLKILYSVSNNVQKKKIIWDAREYYPEQFNQKFLWNFLNNKIIIKLISKSLNKVLIAFTVSEGLRDKYQKTFNKKFLIFYSVANFFKLKPKFPKKIISIVHHGVCSETRKIENYFELGKKLGSGYKVYLMLKIVNQHYYENLIKLYKNVKNVKFLSPAKMHDIPKKINKFDIGIMLGLKKSFNHIYAMPNKLFESIQGRLCLIYNPLIDARNFIKKNKCGYCSSDFSIDSMANLIKQLNQNDIYKAKLASNELSRKYNTKNFYKDFDKIFKKLVT